MESLKAEGVEHIFGIPGGANLPTYDALVDAGFHHVQVRHEQGGGHAAEGYAKASGKVGVAFATSGPGATNLITAIADAMMDSVPTVFVTGQVRTELIGTDGFQEADVTGITLPIVKHSFLVTDPRQIPQYIHEAFHIASTGRPGPVLLDIPQDLSRADIDYEPRTEPVDLAGYKPSTDGNIKQIRIAAKAIANARRPILYTGGGVVNGNASEELRELARGHGIPVVHTFMAKGSMPYDDDLSLLSAGLQARDYISCGFDKADLIIAVGYDPVEYAPKFWNPDRKKPIIHVDFTPAEVDSFYQPAVEVVADVREALELLNGLVKGEKDPAPFLTLRRFILEQLEEGSTDDSFPLKPQRILRDLRAHMGRDDILISDVGSHKLWIARAYPAYEPNTVLISNGFAAMGFALPAAISAKLVHPEKKVVAVSGDGGFLMNCQELETARRLGLAVVNVIFRDGGYNLIQWKQQTHFGRESGVTFGNPDFVELARAFGAKGFRVDSARQLGPILAEAMAHDGPSIVDVPVDYRENAKLTARLGQLVCPI
jgi:acetolactate synthase-1/2/3 large subunit